VTDSHRFTFSCAASSGDTVFPRHPDWQASSPILHSRDREITLIGKQTTSTAVMEVASV